MKLLPDTASSMYLSFIKRIGAKLRDGDAPPKDLDEWRRRRATLRESLGRALGLESMEASPIEPNGLAQIDRPAWRIELTTLQTMPGVRRTATLYLPKSAGKKPAVLCVHGHWPWARIDPVVQARCLGLVQLGYVVLAVDAFGAGERAIEPKAGAYHGALTGASLWPIGKPLAGVQLYENMRAIDYLVSRPDVDADRLGVTGASGGGNQTMYLGAFDERLKAVVPVCSVGTYASYLGAACCTCEVVPGAVQSTEEGGVLAMVAPRALLVISASQDAIQFSPGEAKKSIAWARDVYRLHNADEKIQHTVFDSPHAYNQPMRERMYGWFDRWLKGNANAPMSIAEPPMRIEEVQQLRCYLNSPTSPLTLAIGDVQAPLRFDNGKRGRARFVLKDPMSNDLVRRDERYSSGRRPEALERPSDFMTIPRFSRQQGDRLVSCYPVVDHVSQWEAFAAERRRRLVEVIFGGFPSRTPLKPTRLVHEETDGRRVDGWTIETEEGVTIPLLRIRTAPTSEKSPICLVVHAEGKERARQESLCESLLANGNEVVVCDLRATGETKVPNDKIADAEGHNSAEWGLWIGRPMLGQWTWDILRAMEHLRAEPGRRVSLFSIGPIGLACLCASAVDPAIHNTVCLEPTASLVMDHAYVGLPMGLLAPRFLELGDVCDVASWIAPRPLRIIGGRGADGRGFEEADMEKAFARGRRAYALLGASKHLRIVPSEKKPIR